MTSSTHPNRQTLKRFYAAFATLDPDAMARCYAPTVEFQDELFSLRGHTEVMGMWRMLCASLQANGRNDWKLDYGPLDADDAVGAAYWEAHYLFGLHARPVHNRIHATFAFDADGLIAYHHDDFDFRRWSRQALGLPAILLGWTPYLRRRVRAKAGASLKKYLAGDAPTQLAATDQGARFRTRG